jgi:hypothetical protein
LAMVLLSGFYLVAGIVLPNSELQLRVKFALGLNAGVVLALSLLPTRRQLPLFLLILMFFSFVVRLVAYPAVFAMIVALMNVVAVITFRSLTLRYAANGGWMNSLKKFLALTGCGLAAVVVSAGGTLALLFLTVSAGGLVVTDLPSLWFLFGTRVAARCNGIIAVTPLMLTLIQHRPSSWPWTAWVETGAWLVGIVALSVLSSGIQAAAPVFPLLLLVAFAGLLLAVLRRGSLAAAVLAPAFALCTSVVMSSSPGRGTGALGSGCSVLLQNGVASFVAVFLAWAVAVTVTERDAARERERAALAAREALASLQRALLPPKVTSAADMMITSRYRVAGSLQQIGGDWYDVIPLPAGGTALVIGDVEGHDLRAASVMGLVRGAVRSNALEGHPPSIIMERVNAFLIGSGTDRLVTMTYAQLYPDDTIATVALAGHPAPLVVPSEGKASALALRRGPILGVEGLTDWPEQTIRLPAGAAFVLYTDGLVDFPSAADDQLSRLLALTTCEGNGPLDPLADMLVSSAPPYDDVAILIARVGSAQRAPSGRYISARRSFPVQAISARVARTWLGDLFAIWQDSEDMPANPDVLETAQLLLTELMSNAIRHSEHRVTLRVHLEGPRLRVEVEDSSDRMPVMREPDDDAAVEGRGLRLVDALAGVWGVQLVERGKRVWFELGLNGVATTGDDGETISERADQGQCVP